MRKYYKLEFLPGGARKTYSIIERIERNTVSETKLVAIFYDIALAKEVLDFLNEEQE